MPQLDLEPKVSVSGGDRKIACETLAGGDQQPEVPNLPDVPPDFPPESIWLSKEAEMDWLDRNAVYERNESTKGNSSSANPNPNSSATSQRYAMNLKSSIIGLPTKQKAGYADSKRRSCKPANIRLFPKRSESVGKSTVPVIEPSSPKVSCMGRVRSKKGRRRSAGAATEAENSTNGDDRVESRSRGGFMAMFRCCRSEKAVVVVERVIEPLPVSPPRKSVTIRGREIPVRTEPVADPPGLGGMMRFASGRKSWTAEDLNLKSDLDRRVEMAAGGPSGS